ncbi:MAG: AcrR family transcriptional regulator, partial [Bacteriovoracaceae bacterium]
EWALKLWPSFKEKGLKKFNMDDASEELGKSKATIYKYFSNREDILSVILENLFKELSQFQSILNDSKLDYIERYKNSIELLSKELKGISGHFLFDLKKYHPKLWLLVEDYKLIVIDELGRFYLEGKRKNILGHTSVQLLKVGDEIFLNALLEPSFLMKNNLKLEESLRAYFENKMFGMLKR